MILNESISLSYHFAEVLLLLILGSITLYFAFITIGYSLTRLAIENKTFFIHFTFHPHQRMACVTRTQPSYVAPGHEVLIKMFRFVFVTSAALHFRFYFNFWARLEIKYPSLFNLMFSLHCCCPHTRISEAISVSARKLIKVVFMHGSLCSACIYFCSVDANSLSGPGFTVTSNSFGALDEEEDIVMKGCLEGFVEENFEENKNEDTDKHELFLRHCWLGFCLGWPPSPCRFYFQP